MRKSLAELAKLLGEDRLVDAETLAQRSTSYWNSAPMQAKAMLLPRSTDEVAKILRWCNENDQTVIIHGGLTNCVAAVESEAHDVILSLEK